MNKHVPCEAPDKINCTDPRFYRDPEIFTQEVGGKSIQEQFLDSNLHDAREIREILRYESPMLPFNKRQENDI